MDTKPFSNCATCGASIEALDIFIKADLLWIVWRIKCPSCDAFNYVHPVVSSVLIPITFILSAIAGIIITRGGNPEWLFLIASLVVYHLLRGIIISLWLRIGRFRRSIV